MTIMNSNQYPHSLEAGPPRRTQAQTEQARLLRMLQFKHTIVFLHWLALGIWVTVWLANMFFRFGGGWVALGFVLACCIGQVVYGIVLRRPSMIGFGFASVCIAYLLLPSIVLQPWVSIIGISLVLLTGLILISPHQPIADQTPLLGLRSLFLFAGFTISVAAIWLGLGLAAGSISNVKPDVVESLQAGASELSYQSGDAILLESQVSVNGRFYSFVQGDERRYFTSRGAPLEVQGQSVLCRPPYPVLPEQSRFAQWLCRVLENPFLSMHDHSQTISRP